MRSGGGLIVSWGLVSIAERIGRWTCLEDVKMLMKLEDGSGIPRGATRSALAKLGVEGGKIALGGKIAKGGGKNTPANQQSTPLLPLHFPTSSLSTTFNPTFSVTTTASSSSFSSSAS